MIHLRDTWQQAVQDVPRVEGDFSPVMHLTPHADAALLTEITPHIVQRWMADATTDEPGADAKLAAAYLMGNVANPVCQVFAALALRGYWLSAAGAGSVGLIPRFVPWAEDGDRGVSMTFDICLAPDALAIGRAARPCRFAKSQEDLFAPLVRRLHSESRLGITALYRLVGDSLAYAFLTHGRALKAEQTAMDTALAILRAPGTKLANKQVRFDQIQLPEAPQISGVLRVRGGCCRAYTRPGKPSYCTTCVLRDDESRIERYRDFLRRTRLSQTERQNR